MRTLERKKLGRASMRGRARSPEAKEQLRSLILQQAVALFVEEGYAGFSMRKLARRLHYSAPTLYAYFANKDELLMAIIGEGYNLFRSHLMMASGDPVDRFAAIGAAFMDFAFRNPTLYRLMFIQRPGSLFDLSEETVRVRLGILTDVVRKARATPLLAHADDATAQRAIELFWAVVHGLVSLALTIPLFDEAWARRNLDFLLDSLRPMLARPDGTKMPRSA